MPRNIVFYLYSTLTNYVSAIYYLQLAFCLTYQMQLDFLVLTKCSFV